MDIQDVSILDPAGNSQEKMSKCCACNKEFKESDLIKRNPKYSFSPRLLCEACADERAYQDSFG